MWRTLLMVLRFGLFPYSLNALLVFFCRSDEQLPHALLRSDPSIECWNGAHWLALGVGAMVFALSGVATPVLLLRALKRTIDTQALEKFDSQDKDQGAAAGGLSIDEEARFTRAFARYDVDGNGWIDQAEMLHLLEEQTGRETNPEIHQSRCRKILGKVLDRKPMSERNVEEMRGWMGLTPDEDVSLVSFLRMLTRLKQELEASAHDQECAPPFVFASVVFW
jgi:hypothetical protein